ncbi:hypothetical protein [Kitasatospora sp. NPDC086791]|uniref:hypothetical protein n=1 Tax=Kitasatospora sp. NPDC086791 TaxID=3155178 RepID=UPI00344406FE
MHLDLKPSNIVIDCRRAKVLDLSIARPPGPGTPGIGTEGYLAPEQPPAARSRRPPMSGASASPSTRPRPANSPSADSRRAPHHRCPHAAACPARSPRRSTPACTSTRTPGPSCPTWRRYWTACSRSAAARSRRARGIHSAGERLHRWWRPSVTGRFGTDTVLLLGSLRQLASGAVVLGIPAVRNRRWEEDRET